MTTACRNTWINYIQCGFADLAFEQSHSYSLGRTCTERERYLKILGSYLPLLYCYKTFDATVTYAYSFFFVKYEGTATRTIEIGSETFTYTGTHSQILQSFLDLITNSNTYEFQGFIHQGQLYVYSYDNTLTFSTATTTSDEIVTINMEDTYESILDIWNCITAEQVCSVINNAKKLIGECNCS